MYRAVPGSRPTPEPNPLLRVDGSLKTMLPYVTGEPRSHDGALPTAGRWLVIATSGANWGCFVLTVVPPGTKTRFGVW